MRTWLLLLAALTFGACSGDSDGTKTDDTGDDDDVTGDDDDLDPVAAILELTGDSGAGMTIYEDQCAVCHQSDGSGGTGPSLQKSISLEEIVETVYFGEGIMAAYGETLSDQEIADVAAYVQTFAP